LIKQLINKTTDFWNVSFIWQTVVMEGKLFVLCQDVYGRTVPLRWR